MNANDLIEAYITEVAERLPRRQRNDVAFELRALLNEELQAKAEAARRDPDAAMATELLRAFGRPAEVAARYHSTLTIIDPANGHRFLQATVIGLAIIWCAGLLMHLGQPIGSGWDVLSILGQWWGGVVIPSLWWPGVLVVYFGVASWVGRRWPQTSTWKPRASARIHANRTALVMGIVGILCGVYVLIDPRWVLDVFWGGLAAPAAYEALTYTDTFRQRQAPFLLGVILLNIPLFIAVVVKGRWSVILRRIETGLILADCAVLAWTVLNGPVFMASSSDRTFKFFLVLIIAFTLIDLGIKLYRRVRPAPNQQIQA